MGLKIINIIILFWIRIHRNSTVVTYSSIYRYSFFIHLECWCAVTYYYDFPFKLTVKLCRQCSLSNFLSVFSSVNFRKFGRILILSLLIANIWVYQEARERRRKGLKLETTYSCLDELDIRYSYHLLLSLAYCRCLAIPDTHVPSRTDIMFWHQDQVP